MHNKSVATQHKINKKICCQQKKFRIQGNIEKVYFSHFNLFIKQSRQFLIHDRIIKINFVAAKADKNSNKNEQKSMG